MKLNKQVITAAGLAMMTGMLLTAVDSEARGNGYGRGQGGGQQAGISTIIAGLPMQDLSAEEELGLTKMREEEKLARDVYLVLYEKWNHNVFSNIASSEQQHMDAVKVLLDKYDMPDPITNPARGEFTDTELQELYNSLIEQGNKSLVDALKVGATIEDLDIKDLYDFLEQTDNTDIKTVYQNLVKGSRNHMRAFVSQLSFNGVTYEAQFLTQAQVDDIITSPRERGRVDENGVQVSGNNNRGSGQMRGQGRGNGRWAQ